MDLDDFSGMKKKKKKKKKPYDMEGLEDALPVCDCVTDLADAIMNGLPVIGSLCLRKNFWNCHRANIASC